MPTRIFVTRHIPSPGIELLRSLPNVEVDSYAEDQIIPRDELLRRVAGIDILVSILTDKIDVEVFAAAGPQLKMIANYAVGFDNVDVAEAKKRGIVVTNAPTPEINESVAEHAIALIFALAHRIVETDRYTREGKYHGWGPELLLGTDIAGKTLGIIGGGAIGSGLARRMKDGFGLRILYNDIKPNPKFEAEFGAEYRTKESLLSEADIVSLHVPLLPSTTHLIGAKELALMKPTALLINTARGPIIDTSALVSALEHGNLGGVGLDVYEGEPNIAVDPGIADRLRRLQNVVLTPHTASATLTTRIAMSKQVVKNIEEFLAGEVPENAVK
ncbi:MAG: D-glycerate dehydrogenase [Patescibacteria group bacterium]